MMKKAVPIQRIDEGLERKQVERLQALRAKRDPGTWEGRDRCRRRHGTLGGEPDATDSGSGGGLCDGRAKFRMRWRKVYGEYREAVVI